MSAQPTPRLCRIDGCDRAAQHQRRTCARHLTRIRRYGDPHFTQWTVADPHDIDIVVRERRPADGLTRLERYLVAVKLTARGVSAAECARLVGVSDRTVVRWRARHRQEAV